MTPNNNVRFTVLGVIGLIVVSLMLAAGEKTGKFVIYVLLAMILLVVLVNYKRFLNLFFTGASG